MNTTPHGKRLSLFADDYETLTTEASKIYWDFDAVVKQFIERHDLEKCRIHEVESLMTGVIYGVSAELRLRQNHAIRTRGQVKK